VSAKWQRVQAFDNEHLTGWLTPVRMVLFLFSSIRLAAVMLVGVALYAVLASIPVGLLALIPMWLIYIASLIAVSCAPGFWHGGVVQTLRCKETTRQIVGVLDYCGSDAARRGGGRVALAPIHLASHQI